MKENKKNIDRLFQEKFRDFEVSPAEKNWEQIKSKLNEEKDSRKRLFPIWLKLGGVAAVLLALLMIGSLWFNTEQTPTVVNQEQNESNEPTQKSISVNQSEEGRNGEKIQNDNLENISSDKTKETVQTLASSNNEKVNAESATQQNQQSTPSQIASEAKERAGTNILAKIETTAPVEIKNRKNNLEISLKDFFDNIKDDKGLNWNLEEDEIVRSEKSRKDSLVENPEFNESEGKSLFDEIAKQETIDKDEQPTSALINRFAIRPNVAPIYYNSMKGGSAVDPSLANNKSEGEVTMSYGVDVSYAVSKKIKVRTGVSKVNMSYSTSDIAYIASAGNEGLKSVRSNPQASNISVVTKSKISNRPDEISSNSAAPYTLGKLNQQLEYIEVPVEVEFAVLDKKFGINVIGGASTLFLKDDFVQLDSDMGTTDLGRAANLNSVSFTTNIGVGFDYNFSETFNFNVEPTFKYQVNGFSGDSGGFKPYYFGIYSGVSVRF